jgi:lipid-binding SYLF domain-containing protein
MALLFEAQDAIPLSLPSIKVPECARRGAALRMDLPPALRAVLLSLCVAHWSGPCNLLPMSYSQTTNPPTGGSGGGGTLYEAASVLQTIEYKNEIPNTAWSKTKCVLVYPSVKKVAVGFGQTYGRGVMVCRTGADMNGPWGAPIMYTLDTSSLGVQLGSSSTDYVLLIITQRGANKILSGKLKLGADASAVAGPTGANAAGFNDPNIDVLSYSQSKGLFAGAALGTASMTADDKINAQLYNKDIDGTQILRTERIPAAAQPLISLLNQISPTRAHEYM